MDNLGINKPAPQEDRSKPIPWDSGDTSVSHAPLNLGGVRSPAPPPAPAPTPTLKKAGVKVTSVSERITGMKTFFAKLHVGSMEFVDEQITAWLKENPGVVIKQTNTTTGMVVSKVTEPNLIITVWY